MSPCRNQVGVKGHGGQLAGTRRNQGFSKNPEQAR